MDTPLLNRIDARKEQRDEPIQITERMSPFMRKLAEKRQSRDRFLAVAPLDRWGGDAA